jgi:hypothetical protein
MEGWAEMLRNEFQKASDWIAGWITYPVQLFKLGDTVMGWIAVAIAISGLVLGFIPEDLPPWISKLTVAMGIYTASYVLYRKALNQWPPNRIKVNTRKPVAILIGAPVRYVHGEILEDQPVALRLIFFLDIITDPSLPPVRYELANNGTVNAGRGSRIKFNEVTMNDAPEESSWGEGFQCKKVIANIEFSPSPKDRVSFLASLASITWRLPLKYDNSIKELKIEFTSDKIHEKLEDLLKQMIKAANYHGASSDALDSLWAYIKTFSVDRNSGNQT